MLKWETFPAFEHRGLCHAFSLRTPEHPDDQLHSLLHPSIRALGWNGRAIVEAQQPHGNRVAAVGIADDGKVIPEVDALATDVPGVVLAIRAADCGPFYLFDPIKRAVGIAHSGKKGTALDIVGATVALFREKYDSRPADLIGFLGPCIRPPHYEIDFAAEIAAQSARAGIGSFIDSGLNTAADLGRYYSYRAEKGQTGRMWAAAMVP